MTSKPVRYSDHLEDRLVLRRIDRDLPERIIREADRNFTDTATGYRIAVATVEYRGVDHLMTDIRESRAETNNFCLAGGTLPVLSSCPR